MAHGRPPRSEPPPIEAMSVGRVLFCCLYAGLFIGLTAIAVRHVELVTGQYLSTGVPPLPAFAGVLLLGCARPILLRHRPRLAPTRAQILLTYAMMTVGVVLNGLYHVRGFLPTLVSLQFWGRNGGPLAPLAQDLPTWATPQNPDAIRHYYQGAPDGQIPWNVWIGPLLVWSLFFLLLYLGVTSAVALVQRHWIRDEKLSFPLLSLPMAISGDERIFGEPGSRKALFLIGVGIAALYNGINILHALVPSAPDLPFNRPLFPLDLERPFTPLRAVKLYHELEAIGIGYFVPLEVSFSAWFFYVLNRIGAVWGSSLGRDEVGWPFNQEQAAGGYLVVGVALLWNLRRSLGGSFRRSFLGDTPDAETSSDRWAWIGFGVSAAGVLGFCQLAGFHWKLAVPYLAILALFALVFARIRAETGVPFQFVFPYGIAKDLVLNSLTVPKAVEAGGTRGMVLFSLFNWMSRWSHLEEQAAYQMDAARLRQEGRVSRRLMFGCLLFAFVFGLAVAYWAHLAGYYSLGSNMIASGGTFGEYRERAARTEFQLMAGQLANPPNQNVGKLMAVGFGAVAAGFLTWLRHVWIGCPFHPIGFLMSTATGETATNFFPMFVAWLCKWTVLKLGGLTLYRRGMPLFLGLAIGHIVIGGILWPLAALAISREAANSFHLLFGE